MKDYVFSKVEPSIRVVDLDEPQPVQVVRQKFPLGKIVITPGASEIMLKGVELNELILRHSRGDWGDSCESDKNENEFAIENDSNILSVYLTPFGKVTIITESDRGRTTILTPDEY